MSWKQFARTIAYSKMNRYCEFCAIVKRTESIIKDICLTCRNTEWGNRRTSYPLSKLVMYYISVFYFALAFHHCGDCTVKYMWPFLLNLPSWRHFSLSRIRLAFRWIRLSYAVFISFLNSHSICEAMEGTINGSFSLYFANMSMLI